MDIKRFLTTMMLTGAIMLAAYYLFPQFFGKAQPPVVTPPTTTYAVVAASQPIAREQGAVAELITLGSSAKASKDKVAVTVNTVTAAIEKVELNINDYAETVARAKPLTLLEAHPNMPKPFATIGIHVSLMPSGREIMLKEPGPNQTIRSVNSRIILDTQYVWKKLPQPNPYEVSMLLTINSGTTPVAAITKTFKVDPHSYEVTIAHEVKNLTDSAIKVEIVQLGATDLPRDNVQMDNRFYHAAKYNTLKKFVDAGSPSWSNSSVAVDLPHGSLQKLPNGTTEIGKGVGNDPVVWIGASNRFFAAIVRPLPRETPKMLDLYEGTHKIPEVDHIAEIHVDALSVDTTDPSKTFTVMRLEGSRIEIAPNGQTNMPLAVFFGPKKRDILQGELAAKTDTDQYSFAAYDYIKMIRFSQGGPCGPCTFDWLALFILKFLDGLVTTVAFGNYGIAIMLLVIIVRLLMHPLTRASQIQMATMSKKMSVIAPEIEAAKKRYAKDKQKQQQELMRIYKENNVNPAGGIMGCLPMLLQMPIWMALYAGLAVDIDLRHASFIPGWIADLSNPDAILSWAPVNVPVLSWLMGPIGSLNLLPLLLGVVFFVQMKVTTASQPKSSDPQQQQMQKMSQWMIMLFPMFLYSAPSGLNVYIFASTIGGLFDTYLVRRTLRKKGILPATAGALMNTDEKK